MLGVKPHNRTHAALNKPHNRTHTAPNKPEAKSNSTRGHHSTHHQRHVSSNSTRGGHRIKAPRPPAPPPRDPAYAFLLFGVGFSGFYAFMMALAIGLRSLGVRWPDSAEQSEKKETASAASERLFQIFIIIAFLSLNSGLSLLNRWALGVYGLRIPLSMTASHMAFGSSVLAPLMLLRDGYAERHEAELLNGWRAIVTISLMNAFQIGCNNASLMLMALSVNQVIRALGPVLVAIIAVFIEKKTPTPHEMPLCSPYQSE